MPPQPGDDAAKVVAESGEQGVDGFAGRSDEKVTVHAVVALRIVKSFSSATALSRPHRVAVPCALTAFDVEQHALAVDRGDFQTANLADAESGRVGSHQCNSVAQSRSALREAGDLVGSKDRRELFGIPPVDDPFERLLLTHRDAIKEP